MAKKKHSEECKFCLERKVACKFGIQIANELKRDEIEMIFIRSNKLVGKNLDRFYIWLQLINQIISFKL